MLGMTLYKFLLSIRIIYEIAKLVSVHAREKQLLRQINHEIAKLVSVNAREKQL